jgi:hypothetical protein
MVLPGNGPGPEGQPPDSPFTGSAAPP